MIIWLFKTIKMSIWMILQRVYSREDQYFKGHQ
eukprot:UN24765